ncbi:MAG: type IV toxin-antitoxin system AbiEi family antitoxin domain-containing protein [Deltaproteobacteria bacterium]|nr:type IV toxin-antitoxin system AbiEi family antitoxin domain-containing protein [Deltaproteobacteria bacterium]
MDQFHQLKKHLANNNFITLTEAKKMGISAMAMSRYVADNKIHRIERGLYTINLEWLTHPLKKYLPVCFNIPEAVICGISALTYYDLTDEIEKETWISIPHAMKLNNKRYRTIRTSGPSYNLGIITHKFGNKRVKIYDLEKTVVDSFKHLWEEVAFKALKGYLKRKDKNIKKLCDYSRKLRKPLDSIVTALLADE